MADSELNFLTPKEEELLSFQKVILHQKRFERPNATIDIKREQTQPKIQEEVPKVSLA